MVIPEVGRAKEGKKVMKEAAVMVPLENLDKGEEDGEELPTMVLALPEEAGVSRILTNRMNMKQADRMKVLQALVQGLARDVHKEEAGFLPAQEEPQEMEEAGAANPLQAVREEGV